MKTTFRTMRRGAIALMTTLVLTSCVKKETEVSHEDAARLFEKSLTLIQAYTDSMCNARDSAHVNKLALTFESKINNLNFEFPPNTDLNLTEEENDSLIKVTDKFVNQQKARLSYFAGKGVDSIPGNEPFEVNDSITVPPFHNQHN